MNLFANVIGQKRSQTAIGVMFCLALSLLTPALAAPPITSSNRFLFIVDISATMKPLDMPLREAVFDLIYSGARGRMTNGDTYGIWLVNDQNDTSFQMETWKDKHLVELAAQATSHVKTNGFKGKARLDIALADALRVVKKIDDLTIIVVSNGETPLAGTPFDEEINTRINGIAPEMKRVKATINTALVAQNGELVAWAINSPDFLINLPNVAPKPKPSKPAKSTMVAQTNVPVPEAKAVETATIPNSPFQARPRAGSGSIIITKESVAKEKLSYLSSTTNFAEPPPVVDATNAMPAVVVPPTTKLIVVITTNSSNAVVAKVAAGIPTNALPTISTALATPIATVADETETLAINLNPNRAETLVPAEKSVSVSVALRWAAIGAGFTLFCMALVWIIVRRHRQEPSLISQALARERVSLH